MRLRSAVYSHRVQPGRSFLVVACGVALVSALTAAARPPVKTAPVTSTAGFLTGVDTLSASDAWAVGYDTVGTGTGALIMHWDGSTWSRVPVPRVPDSSLSWISMSSPRNGWAVGCYRCTTGFQRTLTLRWDGSRWTRVASPSRSGAGTQLEGVSTVSATDAWAVGWYYTQAIPGATVILHWNGTHWARVPSPNPAPGNSALTGVSASTASDAWAVGAPGITLHWNGTRWSVVPSPGGSSLFAVDDVSRGDAWSVGVDAGNTKTVALRWDGTRWDRVASPSPGSGPPDNVPPVNQLTAVSAVSPAQALSVGSYTAKTGKTAPLTLRWNGTAWRRVPSPEGHALSILSGVSMASATDAWAVGGNQQSGKVLILHWNGIAWTQF